MDLSTQGISPRPSLSAWLIALLSSAMVVTVAVLAMAAGWLGRAILLEQSLIAQLELRDFLSAERTLQDLTATPRLLVAGTILESDTETYARRSGLHAARILLSVLSAIDLRSYEDAQSRMASFPANQDEVFTRNIQEKLETLRSDQAMLVKELQRVKELEDSLAANTTQARLVAKDFAEMLSLKPEESGDPQEPPDAYRGGVLKGLPRLQGLRDNIVDLNFLKVELDGLGATVRVEGSDLYRAFTEGLQSLRSNYGALMDNRDKLYEQIDSTESHVEGLNRRLRLSQSEMEAEIVRRTLDLSVNWNLLYRRAE